MSIVLILLIHVHRCFVNTVYKVHSDKFLQSVQKIDNMHFSKFLFFVVNLILELRHQHNG